jgi:hypothetical protein
MLPLSGHNLNARCNQKGVRGVRIYHRRYYTYPACAEIIYGFILHELDMTSLKPQASSLEPASNLEYI